MKLIFYILAFTLASCKNPMLKNNIVLQKKEKDSVIRISNPFKKNNIECYWKYCFTSDGEILMTLKENKTNKPILNYSDILRLDFDYYKNFDYSKEQYLENFQDVNFDGYFDFTIYSNEASGSGGDFSKIYIYNSQKKNYNYSEELSGGEAEIDTINKTLSTYWKSGTTFNYQKIFHFGKNGKIEFIENVVNDYIDNNTWKTEYSKIINDEVVEQKTDTIKE